MNVARLRFVRTPAGRWVASCSRPCWRWRSSGRCLRPTRLTSRSACPSPGPAEGTPFGTDFLGRDVLSRVLWGGRSVLALAGLATVLAYAGGITIGLVAGYSRSLIDPVL